jgi:hypothetical protein
MNTGEHFLHSLLTEFKTEAQPHLRSLWADVEQLEEVTDERRRSLTLRHALHRTRALEWAAHSVNAHEIRALGRDLERMLADLAHAPPAVSRVSPAALRQTMNQLTEALCSVDAEPSTGVRASETSDAPLVACGAD